MSDVRTLLAEADWTERERRHVARAEPIVAPRRERARTGRTHPVWDFLFTYYSFRPRQLMQWHPGYGVALAGTAADRYVQRTGYERIGDGVSVGQGYLTSRVDTVKFIADLLTATETRPARLNCFGMHEWAMVYQARDVRHEVPLRLGSSGTDAVLESMPLRCSHFDAFRFFTDAATGRNAGRLTRETQVRHEQPGCIHANMDLYKWCYKLGPLIDSELLMDCLDLAVQARLLDMKASPYDLTAYDISPIEIENPSGRTEYVQQQQEVAQRAARLRTAVLARCEALMEAASV